MPIEDPAKAPARGDGRPGRSGHPLFAGRARELTALRGALDAALGGLGTLVLLVGEPGIGKTRLAELIASEADERGARALVGRCYEGEGAPAYWSWVMVLRDLAASAGAKRWSRWVGNGASTIGRVVPELTSGAELPEASPELDAESARFRFFDAVATLLGRAAAEQPLVVVLDDLHWADGGSLRLLQFAARQLARSRILFIATLRQAEMRAGADPAIRAELARAGEQLELVGLAVHEVADIIRSIEGHEPRSGLSERIHDVTAGNPFFIDALVRLLASSSDTDGEPQDRIAALRIPDGLHDVIRARLRPLGDEALRLLTIAALIGREFAPEVVAQVDGASPEVVMVAVEEAERLGLVGPPRAGGRRRFVHALILEALARDPTAIERARIHRRIARVLEPLAKAGIVPLDEVTAHHLEATYEGGAEEAISWAGQAAERALARLGYEDAVRYYRRAIEILDAAASDDVARRVDLLLALAEAERRVGDATAACATFARAGGLAREAGLREALARAALGYGAGLGGIWDQGGGTVDSERVELVKAALAAIGPEPSGFRALLLGHLAVSLIWSAASDGRATVERLGREAIATAKRAGDPQVELAVLAGAHVTSWGPDDAEGRLRSAEEIVQRAAVQNQPEISLRGRMYAAVHHLELGDVAAADREVERFGALASELGQLRQLWYVHVYRGMRAHMAGRFDDVERTAEEGMVLGQVAVPLGARLAFGGQLTMVRREQGRAAETIDSMREIGRAAPGMPVWSCALASGLAAAGDLSAARLELERLAVDGFAGLPRDFLWLYSVTQLCRASAALDDASSAAMLYDLLRPYQGRVAVAQHGILCDGAIDRYLGLLAATLARWEDAERHFASGPESNQRLGAAIFVTATQHDHARMLLRRGSAEDTNRAHELLEAASKRARQLGQTALLQSIASTRDARPAPASRPADDVCALRRERSEWNFTHAGRSFAIKHTTGLGHLITLLRHPGREIHALELIAGDETGIRPSAGDAGEMLDQSARDAYRRRLTELEEDLEEARRFNDLSRVERAQAEIEALTDELARAVGRGGRPRLTGSGAERARLNVTRAVRRAIEAIAAKDPALGSDLGRGVRTGIFCSYTPDPRLPVRWEL